MSGSGGVGLGCCVRSLCGFDDLVEIVEHSLVAALFSGIKPDSGEDVKGRESPSRKDRPPAIDCDIRAH